MKKYLLIFALSAVAVGYAQSTYTDLPGRWRIGGNIGGMWQTCDVKSSAGLAGGFTFEKILNKKNNVPIGFALGYRFLQGTTYGMDINPTYGVQNNNAINGISNPAVNYATSPGYFYNNYKSFIRENALELRINFPSFEKKTNVIFNLFGGVGLCRFQTFINTMGANDSLYNFSSIYGKPQTVTGMQKFYSGSYSTLADGSASGMGTLVVLPTVGIGIGYHLTKHLSIMAEYKVSFTPTNYLDGVAYDNKNNPTSGNDYYNYLSLGLTLTHLGEHRAAQTNPVQNSNVYTTNTQNTYPPNVIINYPANFYNSPTDYTTVHATVTNVIGSQQIRISQNGYPVTHFNFNSFNNTLSFQSFLNPGNNNFVVSASNQYGTASQAVTVVYSSLNNGGYNSGYNSGYSNNNNNYNNNYNNNNYNNNNYNNQNNTGTNPANTSTANQVGTTTVTNISTNTVVGTQSVSVQGRKPFVQYINPSIYPAPSETPSYNVMASISNIISAGEVAVKVNGVLINTFEYNSGNSVVTFNTPLQAGYNTITITGTNANGSDTKSVIISYEPKGAPPKVVISNPGSSPFTTTQDQVIVSGFVYNVATSSEINVTSNGNPVTFSYNINSRSIEVPAHLFTDITRVSITATNSYGSDSQSMELDLKGRSINSGPTNTVTVANTHTNTVNEGSTGNGNNITHNGNVNEGPTGNGNNITHNGNVNEGPTGNGNNITHNGNVNEGPTGTGNPDNNGNNTTGGGIGGVQSGLQRPEITVFSPSQNPYQTNSPYISVSANVSNVMNPSMLKVSYNGVELGVSFDNHSEHLNFSSPLKPGLNTFIITATNMKGTSSTSINIDYTPVSVNTNVNPHTVGPVQGQQQVINPSENINHNLNQNEQNHQMNDGNQNQSETGPTYNHGGWHLGGLFSNPNMGNGNPSQGNPNEGRPNIGNPNQGKPNEGRPNMGNPNEGRPGNQGRPEGRPNMGGGQPRGGMRPR